MSNPDNQRFLSADILARDQILRALLLAYEDWFEIHKSEIPAGELGQYEETVRSKTPSLEYYAGLATKMGLVDQSEIENKANQILLDWQRQ